MVVLSTLLSLLLKVGVVDDVDVEVAVLNTFLSLLMKVGVVNNVDVTVLNTCLLYTNDAADERT